MKKTTNVVCFRCRGTGYLRKSSGITCNCIVGNQMRLRDEAAQRASDEITDEFVGLERPILIAMILASRERIRQLECTVGLNIPGWFCDEPCRAFNGEMHSPRVTCRVCGIGKHEVRINTGNEHDEKA